MKAFKEFKLAVFALTYLKYYNVALEIRVKTNAFNRIISKVLSQKHREY